MNIDAGRYWDKALTLVEGCTPVSAGCDNCWSAAMAHRFKQGLTDKGKFTGSIKIREDNLELPLKTKKPTVWAIWNDLFHEDVSIEFIADVFNIMTSCRYVCKKRHEHDFDCETEETGHEYLILTKRPERMKEIINKLPNFIGECWSGDTALSMTMEWGDWLENVWFGTSIENQQTADERIPHLLQITGKKFLSVEPCLGDIDLRKYLASAIGEHYPYKPAFDQVICGGETGRNARPCHPDWVRRLRDQCQVAGVPFFLKSLGKGLSRILDGQTHDSLIWRQNV